MSSVRIVEFEEHTHLDSVRDCLIELQDFERKFDPRMPRGKDIAGEYILQMLDRCEECQGVILVAEVDGEVAGYATILTKVRSAELGEGDIEYGLVSDLMVKKKHQSRGVGRCLLEGAESFARTHGVNWLRVGVLAENQSAQHLYASMGFRALFLELEKDLGRSQTNHERLNL